MSKCERWFILPGYGPIASTPCGYPKLVFELTAASLP